MRVLSRVVSGCFALVVASVSVGGQMASAAPQADTPTEVVSASVSPSEVNVAGLGAVRVEVRVRLRDAEGVQEQGLEDSTFPTVPFVLFQSEPRPLHAIMGAELHRVNGTPEDGEWVGAFYAPAITDGEWSLPNVEVPSHGEARAPSAPIPGGPLRLTVHGTHIPTLSAGWSRSYIRYGEQTILKGRLTDRSSGSPFTGAAIAATGDTLCRPGVGAVDSLVDARGYYRITYGSSGASAMYFERCLNVFGPADAQGRRHAVLFRSNLPALRVYPGVSIELSSARARAGTAVTVSGRVTNGQNCYVHLQRGGASGWRTESSGQAGDGGQYTLRARPPVAGRYAYRVLAIPDQAQPSPCDFSEYGSSSIRYLTVT